MSFGLVKVWNDNDLPFYQRWKDQDIRIEANSFIEMEFEDAHSFKSAGFPMQYDGMGQQTKESYKMIRVDGKPPERVVAFRCELDGSLHPSKAALEEYLKTLPDERLADTEYKAKRKGGASTANA